MLGKEVREEGRRAREGKKRRICKRCKGTKTKSAEARMEGREGSQGRR